MITIVSKAEIIQGKFQYTPKGYTTDENLISTINDNYENVMALWINNNKGALISGSKNISQLINNSSSIYVARQVTTSLDGHNLSEFNFNMIV